MTLPAVAPTPAKPLTEYTCWMSGCERTVSKRMLFVYSIPLLPDLPRFVVMTIAPFAASMPYSAAASGPLRTVIDSMSSGLMSAARLVKSTPRLLNAVEEPGRSDGRAAVFSVLLSIGSPSTIMSGWLLLLIELMPRIVIDEDAPGTPDELTTFTPATRPCSALMKLSRCVPAISGPVTACCEVPIARCAVVCPSAVTTTASRLVATRRSWTSITSAAPTVRSTGAVPRNRNCSTSPTAARMEYLP